MRYEINGCVIRSENAAKPSSQKSAVVDNYFKDLGPCDSILDFGCGKLRYSDTLVKIGSRVTFVDSRIQLERQQVIRGETTSVKDYISENYANGQSIYYEDLDLHRMSYDLITCTNVLSAIPCEQTLAKVVRTLKRLLKKGGLAVYVNQHRSSYFKKFESGVRHLYGYLYRGSSSHSYYGILGKQETEKLLIEHGFVISRSWCIGEITFVEASR